MTELPAYALGLAIFSGAAFLTGWLRRGSREQMWRVGGAIVLNWCAGMLYVHNTGNFTPWQFNLFIDSLAAFIVMWHPAGRAQAYIGLFYFFQIAGHIAFGIREWIGLHSDPVFYYDAITLVAWAQLIALGAWTGGIWGESIVHRFWHRRHAIDGGKASASVRGEK